MVSCLSVELRLYSIHSAFIKALLTFKAIEAISQNDRLDLLNGLSRLIVTLQQDPKPVTELIQNLAWSDSLTFSQVLSIEPPVNLVAGLSSPNADINITILTLIGKASLSSGDSGIIAASPEIVAALISLWLRTSETEVARKALEVLTSLLRVDGHINHVGDKLGPIQQGQGLMWRRLFQDKDVYEIFFSICSLKKVGQPGQPTAREKTIAQSRLLDFILEFPDYYHVVYSQVPKVEQEYGVIDGGLLDFAAEHMVDYKDDILMHATLIDFYTNYLVGKNALPPVEDTKTSIVSSWPLAYLISKDIHARVKSYYEEPEKNAEEGVDISNMYHECAQYLAGYAFHFPSHFLLSSRSQTQSTLKRLANLFVSFNGWSQAYIPRADILVLSSIPRVLLLPSVSWPGFLHYIPIQPPNDDVWTTLAAIFAGPPKPSIEVSQWHQRFLMDEAAAARALYFYYIKDTKDFWERVVKAAETIAIKDIALGAIHMMAAVIGAAWEALPHEPINDPNRPYSLPVEGDLVRQCSGGGRRSFPASGLMAVLSGSALMHVIPYLLKPAQTFGQGDAQSAAFSVAIAKHEVVLLLARKLRDVRDKPDEYPEETAFLSSHVSLAEEIVTCAKRGPFGGATAVGARVGTLDL